MTVLVLNDAQVSKKLITHGNSGCFDPSHESFFNISKFKNDLEKKKETVFPLHEELVLLEQLAQFELGRFLLINKGLNGYWTAYIIIHGPKKDNLHPLEHWILHYAPSFKATQERFKIFQKILQDNLRDNIKIASIPCGLMDDLLTLDYSKSKKVHLIGIDLDAQSLELARDNADKHHLTQVQFFQKDAWKLDVQEEYDMITSNGLNIYEPNDDRVVDLHKQFNKALKPGGIIITSFLTPPPALSKEVTWKNINTEDMLKQKAIFSDIIGVTWRAFRTEAKTRAQLEEAGFQVLEVIDDAQGIFPTIIAKK